MQPLPTRHLASAMFRYDGKSILIDCGEGTQVAIKKKTYYFGDDGIMVTGKQIIDEEEYTFTSKGVLLDD